MKILVLNCGSSSLKYQFIDMENENVLAKGLCERIGAEGSIIKHQGKVEFKNEVPMSDHKAAIGHVIDALLNSDHGVISDIKEVGAVGHRVVHGGEKFTRSVIIDDQVYSAIQECCDLAPLHNPPNLMGIDACSALLPSVDQVAVFDTAFHQTMPEHAYLYAIPYEYYKKYKIRRYGFHGTSHKYVIKRVAELVDEPIEELRIITAHLGNGASVCATDGGKSLDTSMGLTPLEGLVMGTRSGDLDPAILAFIGKKEGITPQEMENILNKKSGVLGVSGLSHDFRDLEEAAEKGNERAKIALEIFFYRVAKYIGQYAVALKGVDVIAFTAGLGENSPFARAKISQYLCAIGAYLDPAKNNVRGKEAMISYDNSHPALYVVPTNEELVIAQDTFDLTR
ncbi:MAG: acetate kinase [Defluviitaleaceae bacterium]|nr:acetate kinase [Defluviitaleaceae bacterium]